MVLSLLLEVNFRQLSFLLKISTSLLQHSLPGSRSGDEANGRGTHQKRQIDWTVWNGSCYIQVDSKEEIWREEEDGVLRGQIEEKFNGLLDEEQVWHWVLARPCMYARLTESVLHNTKGLGVYLDLMARVLHSHGLLSVLLLRHSVSLVVRAAKHLSRWLLYLSLAQCADYAATVDESQAETGILIRCESCENTEDPPCW